MNNIQITFFGNNYYLGNGTYNEKGKFKTENSAEHKENQRTNYSGLG